MHKSFLIVACLVLAIGAFQEEDGVLVLNKDNFDSALKEFEIMMIEFYAPWCGHCKRLAPEYSRTARTLKDNGSKVKLAKVDATVEKELAERFKIEAYPTLIWYENGEFTDYDGGRTEREIIDWVVRKTESPSKYTEDASVIDKELKQENVVVVFWGDEFDPIYTLYQEVSRPYMDIMFYHITNPQAKSALGVPEDVKLSIFRSFEERRVDFDDEISEENLKSFFNLYSVPTLINMNNRYLKKIFGDFNDAIILMYSKGDYNERAIQAFQSIAPELKGKILVATCNADEELGGKVATYYGVEREEIPALAIIHFPEKNKPMKFLFRGQITRENILQFYADFKAGKLKRMPRSESLPERNDQNVKVVVQRTYNDLVLDENKDVALYVYTPECEDCKEHMTKVWEVLAEKTANVKGLMFTKMDISQNEIESLHIEVIPTILIFKKDQKDKPVRYTGLSFSENSVWDWLKNNVKALQK